MKTEKILTIEQIIEREMQRRTIRFWGVDYEDFAPVLAAKQHGDGLKLMEFTPLNTRPNYYLIRVDSSLPVDSDDEEDEEFIREFIDMELIPALEDEFGFCRDADDDDDDDDYDRCPPWPAVDLDVGYCYEFFNEYGDFVR